MSIPDPYVARLVRFHFIWFLSWVHTVGAAAVRPVIMWSSALSDIWFFRGDSERFITFLTADNGEKPARENYRLHILSFRGVDGKRERQK